MASFDERWFSRGTDTCQILFDGVDQDDAVEFEYLLRLTREPLGFPNATATVRRQPGLFELIWRTRGKTKRLTASSPLDVARGLAAFQEWSLVRADVLTRDSRVLLLCGEGAVQVSAGLIERGWTRLCGTVSVVPREGLILFGPQYRILSGGLLVRCVSRAALGRPAVLAPVDVDDAHCLLASVVYGNDSVELRTAIVSACEVVRMVYRDPAMATVALDTYAGSRPITEVDGSLATTVVARAFSVGSTCVRVLAVGFDDTQHALLDYMLHGLAPAAPPSSVLAALGVDVGWHYMRSLFPEKIYVAHDYSFGGLLRRLDELFQEVLVHCETTHNVFLGSGVSKEDTLVWLSGQRGSGKSVLATTLMTTQGFSHFADDFMPWNAATRQAYPFPKPVRFREVMAEVVTELAGRGIVVPAVGDIRGPWLWNPLIELDQTVPTPKDRGLVIRCCWRSDLPDAFVVGKLSRNELAEELRARAQLCGAQESLEASVATLTERFAGFSLTFRDRVAAAAVVARLAAAIN